MKTEQEIENDFYAMLKQSDLYTAIGAMYKRDFRPIEDKGECITFALLSGLDAQFEQGVINCNIYVPSIPAADGRMQPNLNRIGQLQRLIYKFVETCKTAEYWLSLNAKPTTMYNSEIDQYLINARIEYQRLSQE